MAAYLFYFLLFFTLFIIIFVTIAMQWSERNIKVNKPQYQKNFIVRIQFAKSRELLKDMINSVTDRGRDALGFNLGIDYAFMIGLYGFLALFSFMLTKNHPNEGRETIGHIASILMIVPLVADIFENYCLGRWCFDKEWQGPFKIYYLATRIKWIVAIAVGIFCLVSLTLNIISFQRLFIAF